jgi:hypothetical protein
MLQITSRASSATITLAARRIAVREAATDRAARVSADGRLHLGVWRMLGYERCIQLAPAVIAPIRNSPPITKFQPGVDAIEIYQH